MAQKIEQPQLVQHDSTVLDLAFAMDCTGTMGKYIKTAQDNIRIIVEEIVAAEKSDIHLALVEYRDHYPESRTFLTNTHDFTASVKTMKGWLDGCSAEGGGDAPEAVADGLYDVLKLNWRPEATKICILICDAPPHGLYVGQSCTDMFPNGCPDDLDPMKIVGDMAQKGITLYSVGCEPCIGPYKDFFSAIAYITGGQYVPLTEAKALTQIIIGGTQEEISLEKWMEDVNKDVLAEMKAKGSVDIDEDLVCAKVQSALILKGAKSKQLKRNNVALAAPSEFAKKLSSYSTMRDVNIMYEREAQTGRMKKSKKKGGLLRRFRLFCFKNSTDESSVMPTITPIAAPPADSEMDCYNVEESEIQAEQARRMVRKSKMRNMCEYNLAGT